MAAVLAGCGGDSGGGGGSSTATSAPTATTPSTPAPTATATTPAPTAPAPTPPSTSTVPQQSPGEGNGTGGGGGGGTEPARTELTFTGTSAGVSPKQAGVAPYISVKVSLVSKDGSSHKLVIDGKTLSVGGTRKSAFVTLPGLRPGKSYTGTADGNTTIRVLSTSEPGP